MAKKKPKVSKRTDGGVKGNFNRNVARKKNAFVGPTVKEQQGRARDSG